MSRYLLSISGGADSVFLFHKLLNSHIDFDLVHFNHQTRGIDNKIEEEYCKNLALMYEKSFYVFNYNHTVGNFQNEARKFRQNKIKYLVLKYNYDGVYVAHHKDDQVENILMNENKIGLKIMQEFTIRDNVTYIRPLLNIYKSEIYEYLLENNITYFEDYSNNDDKYKRNYYRKICTSLSNEDKDKLINDEIARFQLDKSIECSEISIRNISNKVVLHKFLVYNGYHMSNKFVSMVYESLSVDGNKEYYLNNDTRLYLNYGVLSIGKSMYISQEKFKLTPGVNVFNGFKFQNEFNECYVRSYKPNDFLNNKKINRIFIELKINKQFRDIWPIIVNNKDEVIHVINKKEIL